MFYRLFSVSEMYLCAIRAEREHRNFTMSFFDVIPVTVKLIVITYRGYKHKDVIRKCTKCPRTEISAETENSRNSSLESLC